MQHLLAVAVSSIWQCSIFRQTSRLNRSNSADRQPALQSGDFRSLHLERVRLPTCLPSQPVPRYCQIRLTETLVLRDSCNEVVAHPILGACLKLQQVDVLHEMPLAYGVNGKKSVCCTFGSCGNRGFIDAFLGAKQSVIQNAGERQLNKLICSEISIRNCQIPRLAPLR